MGHRCSWLLSGIEGRSKPPGCLAVIRFRINIGMPRKVRASPRHLVGTDHPPIPPVGIRRSRMRYRRKALQGH